MKRLIRWLFFRKEGQSRAEFEKETKRLEAQMAESVTRIVSLEIERAQCLHDMYNLVTKNRLPASSASLISCEGKNILAYQNPETGSVTRFKLETYHDEA